MTKWPTAEHTLKNEDGTLTVVTFEYCCWTFCAWPELMALLRIPSVPRCAECGAV